MPELRCHHVETKYRPAPIVTPQALDHHYFVRYPYITNPQFNRPHVAGFIDHQPITFLFDTGADISIISQAQLPALLFSAVQELGSPIFCFPYNVHQTVPEAQLLGLRVPRITHVANVSITLFDLCFTFSLHLLDEPLAVPIFGNDFITILSAAPFPDESEILIRLTRPIHDLK